MKAQTSTLGNKEIERIAEFNESNPARLLGPHLTEAGLTIRAFLPRAKKAWIRRLDTGRRHEMIQLHKDGFFEVHFKDSKVPAYVIGFMDSTGYMEEREDAYSFPPSLSDYDLYLISEGTHQQVYDKLGAHIIDRDNVRGVRFAVWAPNASAVSVVGNFNHWHIGAHPMISRGSSGIWELFVPRLDENEVYKFAVKSASTQTVIMKTDPYAFRTEPRPRTGAIVANLDYQWNDEQWMKQRSKGNFSSIPISIYEVHLGSWKRKGARGEEFLSYRELADQLIPYVKEMGFTHIELLPILEHPLDDSWGYQAVNYYSPTSRYGNPRDFMYLVDKCHQNGVGVILDWVPGHFPRDDYGIALFDGTHLYDHQDPRKGEHKEWGTYIFNYSRNEVRNFLIANALFWLSKYHIDGLRVDAVASMLYLDYSRKEGEWIPNEYGGRENIEAINFLRQLNDTVHTVYPGALMIAEESTAWTGVSRPTHVGGLGFDFKWNMGWMHDTLEYFSREPIHRKYHHNTLTFSMIYAYTENFILTFSHDEVVYGKKSMLSKMSGDEWQQFANLRLCYGYMFAHPGKKLLFMGSEFGQWNEWNFRQSLDWHLLKEPRHAQIQQLVRDLNRVYRKNRALHEVDFSYEGFEWIDFEDVEQSVISFMRKSNDAKNMAVVVCNMTPVPRTQYRVGVPRRGFYKEIINTDALEYGGSGMGNLGGVESDDTPWHGRPHSISLTLPPLSALMMELKTRR